MAEHKETSNQETSAQLIKAFKELLLEKDLKKITIKDITDRVDMFRATFYTYFPDKYAIFEAILEDELFKTMRSLINNDMLLEAIEFMFRYFYNNSKFYQKAFEYTGENSCIDSLYAGLKEIIVEIIAKYQSRFTQEFQKFTQDVNIADYLVSALILGIRHLVEFPEHDKDEKTLAEVTEVIYNIVTHGVYYYFKDDEKSSGSNKAD